MRGLHIKDMSASAASPEPTAARAALEAHKARARRRNVRKAPYRKVVLPMQLLVMTMYAKSMTIKEIANATGKSTKTIATIMASPLFQEELEKLKHAVTRQTAQSIERSVATRISEEARPSLDLLLQLRDSDSVPLRLRADIAESILDRAGYKAVDRHETVQKVLIDARVSSRILAALADVNKIRQEHGERADG
jgi:hypothetical protein